MKGRENSSVGDNSVVHPAQRVGVFIDAQNIYHSAKNLYSARVNFSELIKETVAGRPLVRAVAYVVRGEPSSSKATGGKSSSVKVGRGEEESFFEALRKTGLELRLKDIQVYPGGVKKADWDVGMAVDAIRMANFLDVVILVTGDGDFVPLVEYLKWGMGIQVEVAAFGETTSSRLREAADRFTNLDNMSRVLLKIRRAKRR